MHLFKKAVVPTPHAVTQAGVNRRQHHGWLAFASEHVKVVLSAFCAFLVAVDIVGNNWELNNFVGDAKHLYTPLMNINTTDQLVSSFYFPAGWSPLTTSNVGRWMIQTAIDQVHDSARSVYHLTMSQHLIQDPTNDVCGTLAKTYILTNATVGSVVHLGTVEDHISFIRGNTLTHLFGSTTSDPEASAGDNATTLTAMGYVPGRVGLDMHLTTSVQVPPPGQSIAANVTMYRFFSKAFCSGCNPGTELGMDTCGVVYSYDDTTNAFVVRSSQAIYGTYHVLGFTFTRRWTAIASIVVRTLCVLMAISAFACSQKTIRWTDSLTLTSWFKRIKHMLAPPHYRHASHAFDFVYFCFNSDFFVFLYSAAILMDEDVAMIYARVMNRWAMPAGFNVWTNLRLWALGIRWLWFNLALLKLLKVLFNFLGTARHSGANFVVGWFNFRSTLSVFLTATALFSRTDYIEHGNAVRVDLTSRTQNLDTVYVAFGDSWYIRALPSLLCLMLANLMVVLVADHLVNRRWWRVAAKNSFQRQHVFNSTSILADVGLLVEDTSTYHATVTIPARSMCAFQWFFTSHVLCFGLPEEPGLVRQFTASNVQASRQQSTQEDDAPLLDAMARTHDETPAAASTTLEVPHIVVQDDEGKIHLFNAEKSEVQSLGIEVKILRDASYRIG
ncbi:Aste57867_10181 [Aphanomyces stellatus]|uniref:Aste57867_10181 protein n=1 Tax=Aphanomyces stellatus TaxID=120398 RepID=A0A485KQ75_9STRA|nr:hypothetical protein As57867_010142 [Aphanomyces stellatus]VFT87057.1 Aste57867_10181 [Aphanomyces stellatus]